MRLRYLLAIAALGTGGYFYMNKPSAEPVVVNIDPQKVKNRREMIRFYERAIRDLEEGMGYKSKVNIIPSGATNYDPYANAIPRTSASHSTFHAHKKQIEEYRRRIAVMKAEIGE